MFKFTPCRTIVLTAVMTDVKLVAEGALRASTGSHKLSKNVLQRLHCLNGI